MTSPTPTDADDSSQPTADDSDESDAVVISRSTLVIASVFMALPAMIPFYFAVVEEDTTIRALFGGFGVVILIANGLLLALIHRWLTRYMSS